MVDQLIHNLIRIIWMISIFCFTVGLYQLAISLFAIRRQRTKLLSPPSHRFLILIAARNEGPVIGPLIDSLMQLRYPRHLFEVLVIPNNCTDDTEAVASSLGARVLPCTAQVRTKGEVLAFAFDHLPEELRADAYCVFDADNVVHPDFLAHMNQALADGHKAAQGYRDSKNPHDTVISACTSIFYWINNRFYNHARSALNLSAMINGTGFMVSDSLLRRMGGWRTHTMTEDIEWSTQCILLGEKIAWVPGAVTFDEQPMTFTQSWVQRKRWTIGVLQCVQRYFKPLILNLGQNLSLQNADTLLYFIGSIVQYLSVFVALFGFILRLVVLNGPLFPLTPFYDQFFQSLGLSLLIPFAMALQAVLIEGKMRRGIWKGVLFFWFFMASWLIINIMCLLTFQSRFEWTPIRHTRSISMKDLSA